jgi:ribosomal protein L10
MHLWNARSALATPLAPALSELSSVLAGPMILLHSASPPSPAYLAALLTAINKATSFKPPATAGVTPFTTSAALSAPPLAAVPINPKIFCVGAVVDGEVITAGGVQTLGSLPDLDTLRAQIVGLISAPAAQLSGVLSAAAGGQLSRVLEGLKVKLGGGDEGEASAPEGDKAA